MDQLTDQGVDFVAAIAIVRDAIVAALRRADAHAASAWYTEDACLVAPSAGCIRGRTDITRFWQAGLDAGLRDLQLQPDRVVSEAGRVIAIEVGGYLMAMRSTDGPETVDRGTYALVHRRGQDGSWRRTLEIFEPAIVRVRDR